MSTTSEEAAATTTTTTTDTVTMIVLQSSDGDIFEIPEIVAMESKTLKNMIEDECASAAIPLPNVTSATLSKVIEYCKQHAETPKEGDYKAELKKFDDEFVKVDDQRILFDLILAANYLNINDLMDLTCQCIADNIKDKSVEEVRRLFNIENDFTPEEEAEVRKENAWAFE